MAYREPAYAVEIYRLVQEPIEFGEEGPPWFCGSAWGRNGRKERIRTRSTAAGNESSKDSCGRDRFIDLIRIGALKPSDRHVDGIVDMMLDATRQYAQPLTPERLLAWHASFPAGRSGMTAIRTGAWRDDSTGPMQVVSGPAGKSVSTTKRRRRNFSTPTFRPS